MTIPATLINCANPHIPYAFLSEVNPVGSERTHIVVVWAYRAWDMGRAGDPVIASTIESDDYIIDNSDLKRIYSLQGDVSDGHRVADILHTKARIRGGFMRYKEVPVGADLETCRDAVDELVQKAVSALDPYDEGLSPDIVYQIRHALTRSFVSYYYCTR